MKLLAIETGSEQCSLALLWDNETHAKRALVPGRHGEVILGLTQELLDQVGGAVNDLTAIALGRGPGSFTGLRIAAAVTQGLAFGLEIPVVPVSSLACLAHQVWRRTRCTQAAACIDARMGEVYWGCYEVDELGVRQQGEERVCSATDVTVPFTGDWAAAGTGWLVQGETLRGVLAEPPQAVYPDWLPDAVDLLPLAISAYQQGRAVPAEFAIPVYLRDRVA